MTRSAVKIRTIDGRTYYSIADAAKTLGTNAQKIRALIGEGKLEARQLRFNSKRFLISGESIVRHKYPGKDGTG